MPVYRFGVQRASPVQWAGPKRFHQPPISIDQLPPIEAVILSHNHYDHLDVDTLARLKREHDPEVFTPLGNDSIVQAAVPGMCCRVGDWGDVLDFDAIKLLKFGA